MTVEIKVFGPGCDRCKQLAKNATEAVAELAMDAEVTEVHDVEAIVSAGIMQTPGLMVGGKVVSSGRVPSVGQLKEILSTDA